MKRLQEFFAWMYALGIVLAICFGFYWSFKEGSHQDKVVQEVLNEYPLVREVKPMVDKLPNKRQYYFIARFSNGKQITSDRHPNIDSAAFNLKYKLDLALVRID